MGEGQPEGGSAKTEMIWRALEFSLGLMCEMKFDFDPLGKVRHP